MTDRSQPASLGLFALVSYIPDPLGSFLNELRTALPGVEYPEPHITILPPRPLTVPVEEASILARTALDAFSSFDIELSSVRWFPSPQILYIDLVEGDDTVRHLHDALNSNELRHPEEFDFNPHLTLSGFIPVEELREAMHQAEANWKAAPCSRKFSVREIVFLWSPAGTPGIWHRLWIHTLRQGAKAASATPQRRV